MNNNIAIWWKRLLSNIIDIVIVSVIIGVVYEAMDIGISYAGSGVGIYLGGLLSIIGLLNDMDTLVNGFIVVAIILVFFFIQELIFKRTIGKFILGLEITTKEDKKPEVFVLFLRQLFKFFPLTRISLIKEYPIGLHNSILNLKVIDANNSILKLNKELITTNIKSIVNNPSSKTNLERLNLLFDLKQKGAISEQEYEKMKRELIGNKVEDKSNEIITGSKNKYNAQETIKSQSKQSEYIASSFVILLIIGISIYCLQLKSIQKEETIKATEEITNIKKEVVNNQIIKLNKLFGESYDLDKNLDTSFSWLRITNIITLSKYTEIQFTYNNGNSGWVSINTNTYLVDDKKRKYQLLEAVDIPISPEKKHFFKENESVNFTLYFQPISNLSSKINMIECDNDAHCFNIYNINLENQ